MIQLPTAATDRRLSSEPETTVLRAWRQHPFVLLVGESGVGKTFLAERLHRAVEPHGRLQRVNCRQIPPDVSLRTVLGGEFCEAGPRSAAEPAVTVLVREIEALSPCGQLQLLEQLDATLLAHEQLCHWILTSRIDLSVAVAEGRFRDDLFYRIWMYRHQVPRLIDRSDEMTMLARQFIQADIARLGKPITRIDDSFVAALHTHDWPGNVRELKHAIQRAVINCQQRSLSARHLPIPVPTIQPAGVRDLDAESEPTDSGETSGGSHLENQVAATERVEIEQALQRNQHSRTRASQELGISRVTLYNKMKKLGMATHKTGDR